MAAERTHVFDLDPTALQAWCVTHRLPGFTATQVLDWVYAKGVGDPSAMTNIPKRAREALAAELTFVRGRALRHQLATDGTQKILMGWPDAAEMLPLAEPAQQTECVMIPTEDRRTACISSQVGCPVGCTFCASGVGGLDGNLTAGQIVEQVWHLSRLDGVGRISNVVFMGMGEPLANYQAVTDAIRTLNAPWAMGIGARRITVSTVGLPAAIRKFCEFELPVTLALSLHAPFDELRRAIIPWAQYSTVAELLDACREWFERTGREITLEYILLGRVNDRPEHANELARLAKTLRANVNLIRYNEVAGMPYERPTKESVLAFQEILRMKGVNVHIRASRGRDIAAACGQLRHESMRRDAPAA